MIARSYGLKPEPLCVETGLAPEASRQDRRGESRRCDAARPPCHSLPPRRVVGQVSDRHPRRLADDRSRGGRYARRRSSPTPGAHVARHRSTPPAHDGRTQPLRPDHRARPRRRDVRRHRVGRHRGARAGRRDRPPRQGPRGHRRLAGGSGRRTPRRHGDARCRRRDPHHRPVGHRRRRAVDRCTRRSAASSTTSSSASTGPRSPTSTARPARSPPPSSRRPHARRAFPCWDEPAFKAVFGVTLVVARGPLRHLQRGRGVRREPTGDGRRRVTFADTMVMSTYLVAFVVGPLETTDPVDVDGVPLRVACPPGKKHLTDFALEVGAFSPAVPRRLLRHPLSRRQGRPGRHPRLRVRGHGEPGLHHVPRDGAPARPRPRAAGGAAARRRRRGPRAGPHVVRRPGDHGVVERDLAERGLRHVHGDADHRRLPPGVGAVGGLRPRPLRRVRHRLARPPPGRSSTRSSPRPTPRACSTSSPTRRARRSCGCWSSTSARTASRPASATTCRRTATGTPRPPTCGTPSRPPPASRCAASWTPGSSRPATPSSPSRSATTGARSGSRSGSSATTPTRPPTRCSPSRWSCASAGATRRHGSGEQVARPARHRRHDGRPRRAGRLGRSPTTRAAASTGCATPTATSRRSPLGPSATCRRSSATAWSRTSGPPSCPAPRRRARMLALLRHFADETDLSVWQRIVGVANALQRLVPDDARADLRGPPAGPRGAGVPGARADPGRW